jgi:hypothetical protein
MASPNMEVVLADLDELRAELAVVSTTDFSIVYPPDPWLNPVGYVAIFPRARLAEQLTQAAKLTNTPSTTKLTHAYYAFRHELSQDDERDLEKTHLWKLADTIRNPIILQDLPFLLRGEPGVSPAQQRYAFIGAANSRESLAPLVADYMSRLLADRAFRVHVTSTRLVTPASGQTRTGVHLLRTTTAVFPLDKPLASLCYVVTVLPTSPLFDLLVAQHQLAVGRGAYTRKNLPEPWMLHGVFVFGYRAGPTPLPSFASQKPTTVSPTSVSAPVSVPWATDPTRQFVPPARGEVSIQGETIEQKQSTFMTSLHENEAEALYSPADLVACVSLTAKAIARAARQQLPAVDHLPANRAKRRLQDPEVGWTWLNVDEAVTRSGPDQVTLDFFGRVRHAIEERGGRGEEKKNQSGDSDRLLISARPETLTLVSAEQRTQLDQLVQQDLDTK